MMRLRLGCLLPMPLLPPPLLLRLLLLMCRCCWTIVCVAVPSVRAAHKLLASPMDCWPGCEAAGYAATVGSPLPSGGLLLRLLRHACLALVTCTPSTPFRLSSEGQEPAPG